MIFIYLLLPHTRISNSIRYQDSITDIYPQTPTISNYAIRWKSNMSGCRGLCIEVWKTSTTACGAALWCSWDSKQGFSLLKSETMMGKNFVLWWSIIQGPKTTVVVLGACYPTNKWYFHWVCLPTLKQYAIASWFTILSSRPIHLTVIAESGLCVGVNQKGNSGYNIGVGACSFPEAREVHMKFSWAGVIPLQVEKEASPLRRMSWIQTNSWSQVSWLSCNKICKSKKAMLHAQPPAAKNRRAKQRKKSVGRGKIFVESVKEWD